MRYIFTIIFIALLASPAMAKASYDKDFFGETKIYRAVFEDTLIHLARNNELGFVELRAANPTLDPWIPGAGARIVLPKQHLLPEAPRKGLVINLSEMRVYYFKKPGEAPLTYPISIGREGLKTPVGKTTIVRKKEGPTWRPTDRMRKEDPELPAVVPPGPENPLGTHALYLGWPQYALHGTNKPYGIGRRVSSGCIRMYPEHIVELFPKVPVGTQVTVVDQPVKAGWIDDKMYVEVSPTQDQSIKIEEDGVLKSYEITTEDMKRITKKAGAHADKIDWVKVRRAVQEHRGYPIPVLQIGRNPGRSAEGELQEMLNEADASKKDVEQIQKTVEKAKATEPSNQAAVIQQSNDFRIDNFSRPAFNE